MLDGKIKKKYLCLYPDCNKRYVTSDGLRKHCKKYHMQWLEGKNPRDYGCEIPEEYEGEDYVRDYMDMVRAILAEEVNNISPPRKPSPPREPTPPREEILPLVQQPITLVIPPVPFVSLPTQIPRDVGLNMPIDFYESLFCNETL